MAGRRAQGLRDGARASLTGLSMAILIVVLLAPTILAVPMALTGGETLTFPPEGLSLRWFDDFWSDSDWTNSLLFSVWTSVCAASVATLIGGLAAWPMSRVEFRGRQVLNAIAISPLFIPPIAIATGVYLVWAEFRLIGSPAAIILTHALLGMPFVLIVASAAMRRIDDEILRAAASVGAGPVRTAWSVIVPSCASSLIAGWAFALAISLDEVVLTQFLLAPGGERTLAVTIFSEVQENLTPLVGVAAVIYAVVGVMVAVIAAGRETAAEQT